MIATNFKANKGRLPWPLEKGVVIQGFGRQRHPVVKTATIQSNGVVIATEPSAQVRSVFEGEVMSVIIIKGTKIGRGLMHLPVEIIDLRDTLLEALKDYSKNTPALTRVVKLLEELFRRDGISRSKYEAIKKDLDVL